MRTPVVMSVVYIFAGLLHLIRPRMYLPMMPAWLPRPHQLILLSGVAEIALGALLLPERTRALAAWGIIALLVAVFPANVEMWRRRNTTFRRFPNWLLALRLPLQLLLMYWAYAYTTPVLGPA